MPNDTTPLLSTTPAPTPAPFCFTCGFNFGHLMDGVDDRTSGALIVVLFLMVVLAIGVVVACLMHNWCCGTGEYRHVSKGDGSDTGSNANTKE